VLDEYCARYGVRGCRRHLSYLNDLLNNAERGTMIDPTLMHYSFAFCASHVHGHRYICTVAAGVFSSVLANRLSGKNISEMTYFVSSGK